MESSASKIIRVAFLGADETAVKLARAVIAHHRFELAGVCEVESGEDAAIGDAFQAIVARARRFEHWESLLDTDLVDAVVVARAADEDLRAEQLRKLIQAGVPLVVSHPVVESMLIYYELDMIRRETGCVVLPYLPTRNHPAMVDLARWVRQGTQSPVGKAVQLVMQRPIAHPDKRRVAALFARDVDLVRSIGGEMTKLGAMAGATDAAAFDSLGVHMSGVEGLVARWSVDPTQNTASPELQLLGSLGRATVVLRPDDQPWQLEVSAGERLEVQNFEPWNPAESTLEQLAAAIDGGSVAPDWVDAARSVELTETIDRSLLKGRTIELYYEDYTEQGTFKGTMTSLGCGLLLLAMMMLGVVAIGEQIGLPFMRAWPYVLLAALGTFLVLQLLMLVFRTSDPPAESPLSSHAGDAPSR